MSWNTANKGAPWWKTLAFRLTAGYALAGLCLVFLATASLYLVLRSELEKSTELFLADKLHVVRTLLRERPDDWDGLREEIELESAARRYQQFYIRLLDEHSAPLLTTPGMAEQLDLSLLTKQTRPYHLFSMRGMRGQSFRVTSAPAEVGSPSTRTDTIEIAIDVSQQKALLARYRRWFLAILLGCLAIFPLIGYRVARHGIRPVEEIATTARHISSTNLRERIQPDGYPSELASLADTFNKMLDRLQESFERISKFSADIAHDLRTPVNNIRGEAEVALARARNVEEYRDVLGSCLEETVRLSDLISDLLFLARAESPLAHLHREPVNIVEILDGVQRAVGNLVSNALAHTPSGGTITLGTTLGTGVEAATVRIEISDTGEGIPPEALPKVFDRFYRVDTSRSQKSGGTGLGLSIVQSIVLLHGGNVEIASQPGQGTRVTLRIPVL